MTDRPQWIESALATLKNVGSALGKFLGVIVLIFAAQWLVFRCPLPFIAPLWNVVSYDESFLHTRYRVADGLELSGKLDGKNRAEVLALLGPPPPTNKFSEYGLVYRLGPGRSWASLDFEWLVIDFNSAGRVAGAKVVYD